MLAKMGVEEGDQTNDLLVASTSSNPKSLRLMEHHLTVLFQIAEIRRGETTREEQKMSSIEVLGSYFCPNPWQAPIVARERAMSAKKTIDKASLALGVSRWPERVFGTRPFSRELPPRPRKRCLIKLTIQAFTINQIERRRNGEGSE